MFAPGPIEAIDLWQRAASYAALMHASQRRKDGVTPYFAHPARVALVIREVFEVADPICLAAAYLHDVIEDTPADYDDVVERFGTPIATVVAAMTKDMRLPEPEREQAYDEQLLRADWRARLVKLADVYDNLCDRVTRIDTRSPKQGVERVERAITIAEPLARGDGQEAAALQRGIAALRELVVAHQAMWEEEQRGAKRA
ncbi:MAG: HD domain-containing protein [Planctomycetota bacterium]